MMDLPLIGSRRLLRWFMMEMMAVVSLSFIGQNFENQHEATSSMENHFTNLSRETR